MTGGEYTPVRWRGNRHVEGIEPWHSFPRPQYRLAVGICRITITASSRAD